jgi:hypothetical protein
MSHNFCFAKIDSPKQIFRTQISTVSFSKLLQYITVPGTTSAGSAQPTNTVATVSQPHYTTLYSRPQEITLFCFFVGIYQDQHQANATENDSCNYELNILPRSPSLRSTPTPLVVRVLVEVWLVVRDSFCGEARGCVLVVTWIL